MTITTTEVKTITSTKFTKYENCDMTLAGYKALQYVNLPHSRLNIEGGCKDLSDFNDYMTFLKDNIEPSILLSIVKRSISNMSVQIISQILNRRPFLNILEIGTFKGYSAGLYKYFSPKSYVTTIDIADNPEKYVLWDLFDYSPIFVHGTSSQIPPGKYDFVFIDGEHTYDWCRFDWNNVVPHLADNAIVLFDDLNHGGGCGNMFHEIVESDKYVTELWEFKGNPILGAVNYTI